MNAGIAQDLKGYELRERIGAGGFGAVYRAYQSTIGREVAIKFILPGMANQPDFIRRFESEAQLVARLEHPHIIPLYDYWRDPDGAYLVMRWVRGGSLRDALQNGPFDLRSAARLLDQVAGALSLAHRNNVIHRDIKPANILLDEDGNAYLTDFGIAKDLNLNISNTQPDAIIGSLDYISPEQARGEPVTARTDLYSLAVTLYEVICGHHPFENISPIERLYKHINDPLPELTGLDDAVEAAVNRVIHKASAKDPDRRYPDALAFAADFREAIGFSRTPTDVIELLTQREHEILQLIVEGLSNKEIAQRLTISLSTVKWYVNQIYGKLGVRSRVQAIIQARELKLIGKPSETQILAPIPTEDFHPENPYKGLRAFQSADYKDFFGREKLVEKLISRLAETPTSPAQQSRFLTVVGPSGSGKSSLVKAGLIPAIWRGDLPGSEKWFVVEMLPGAQPLDELEIALTKVAAQHASGIHEQLERDENGLVRVAQLILPNDGSDLLLVIDQFEEVFTLLEDEAQRRHFLNLLHAAVTAPRSRVRLVITLRADFYDRPLHYPEFGELVRTHLETILPLTAEELERAITNPAQAVGLSYEPGLVSAIVSDVKYQPGALPLLQYALTELFEQRTGRLLTLEAYTAIGRTTGALAKRAEEIYLGLDSPGQEAARQMFLRLVTLGEGVEDTRRRVARSELSAISADADLMDDLLDTFAAYRLLSLDNDPGTRTPTVEVAHEAILREWERLRIWLSDSRDDIKQQRQLASLAAEWEAAHRDSSFLLRGSRLEVLEKWSTATSLAFTPGERTYLATSLTTRTQEQAAEAERQMREKILERRSVRFLRALVAVLLLAVLSAFGLTGVAVNQSNIAQQNAVRADHNAAEAQNVALIAGSQAAFAKGNTDLAIALGLQAAQLNPQSPEAQVNLSEVAYAPGTIRRFVGHTDAVASIAYSPDGRSMVSASDDKTLILWDVATSQIIRQFTGHTDKAITVAFSPDGRTILSGSNNFAGSKDNRVLLWDAATGQIIREFVGHTAGVWAVAFSPDGRTALSAGTDKIPILWDVATGQIIHRLGADGSGHTDQIESVAISPDGRTALTGSWDTTLILWDLATGKAIRRFGAEGEGHNNPVLKVVFSPNGRQALSGAQESMIILWDIATGEVIHRFNDGQFWVFGLAFSPDGHKALSTSLQGSLTLWDVDTGELLHRFRGHSGPAVSVAFSPDGHTVISSAGENDHEPRLWDLEQGQIIRRFPVHTKALIAIARSPDGRRAITTADDSTVISWDLQSGQEIWRYPALTWAADYAPDGKTALLATISIPSGEQGDLILVDSDTGREIRRFGPVPSGVNSVAFSPDSRTAVSGGNGRINVLWDVATGREIDRFSGYENGILDHTPEATWKVAFSPEGTQVLTGFGRYTIVVWDAVSGEKIREITGDNGAYTGTTFSFHDQLALVGESDGGVTLWDTTGGSALQRIHPHMARITLAEITPDARFGISSSVDNTTVLWDLQTGDVLRRWGTPNNIMTILSFSSDGKEAIVGFSSGAVELWHIDTTLDQLTNWIYTNRYVPELTCDQRALYRLEPLCTSDTGVPGVG